MYLRDGGKREWVRDDLQSFTPTRFLPPQLMGYQGRAVVIDPDVFARGDIWELLSRDWRRPWSWHGHASPKIRCARGPQGHARMWAWS